MEHAYIDNTVTWLSIRLCTCCFGVYFNYKCRFFLPHQESSFYLKYEEIDQYLQRTCQELHSKYTTYNIEKDAFEFDIVELFKQEKTDEILIDAFNAMYKKFVLNVYLN